MVVGWRFGGNIMVTGLGLGFAASGHQAVATAAGLVATDPLESFYGYDGSVTNTSSDSRDITISLWFKDDNHNSAATSDTAFRFKHLTGGTNLLNFEYQGGRMRLLALDANVAWGFDYFIGTYSGTYGGGTYDDGNWHHMVFSRDGSASTEHLYIDGYETGFTVNAGRQSFTPNVWQGTEWSEVSILAEGDGGNLCGMFVTQIFVDNVYYDLSDAGTLDKFYNGGAVDMGTDGTSSGLAQPITFHIGDTSTILDNGGDGTFTYTLTENGTGADITADDGPQLIIPRPALSITAINDAQLDTAQKKFGSASVEFDGTGDALKIPKIPHWNGSGDMTFEAFVRTNDVNGGQAIFEFRGLDASYGGSGTYASSDAKTINIFMDYGGDFKFYVNSAYRQTGTGQFSNDTWHHVAVQRSSGVWNAWVDGTRCVEYTSSSDYTATLKDYEQPIGFRGFATPADQWNGYMDEIRISNVARYANGASITVPTAEFTNDYSTILLLHCNGANASTTFTDDNAIS